MSRATGLLRGSNSVCMNGMAVKRDLESRLGRTIAIANDANCFALSEATDGAGCDADIVFGAILGTGVGGGVVIRGELVDGPNGIAGEWGHNPLPWPARRRTSGPANASADAAAASRPGCPDRASSATTPAVLPAAESTAQDIVARAAAGDRACEATLARYE